MPRTPIGPSPFREDHEQVQELSDDGIPSQLRYMTDIRERHAVTGRDFAAAREATGQLAATAGEPRPGAAAASSIVGAFDCRNEARPFSHGMKLQELGADELAYRKAVDASIAEQRGRGQDNSKRARRTPTPQRAQGSSQTHLGRRVHPRSGRVTFPSVARLRGMQTLQGMPQHPCHRPG